MLESPTAASTTDPRIARRTIIKAAAWTVPVMTLAVAAPAAAASVDSNVGAFTLTGTCGVLGVLGPGFLLKADPSIALPAGTSITVTGSGIANIGVFSTSGSPASVSVLSGTSRLFTLTADLPASAQMAFRTTLSISVAFTLTGSLTLPSGYTSSTGKASGSVSSTLVLCSAT